MQFCVEKPVEFNSYMITEYDVILVGVQMTQTVPLGFYGWKKWKTYKYFYFLFNRSTKKAVSYV